MKNVKDFKSEFFFSVTKTDEMTLMFLTKKNGQIAWSRRVQYTNSVIDLKIS